MHGRFLHGEWFLEGQRCPGGDHSAPLPAGLSERPPAPADFPEMCPRLDIFDGCPNQFAYGDNFYQIAVWRAKTASWAKHRLADACTTRPQGLAQGLDQGLTLAQALVAHFGHQALVESPPRLGGALVVYKKPLGGDFWELDDFWRRLGKGHRLGKDGAR